jgi:hypothetical protein
MRITALLLILSLSAAGVAADPPATPAAPPAAPAAQAPTAAAPAAATTVPNTNPGGVSNEVLKKATRMGLKPRQRKGTTMFCKDYADIGTRIPSEHCYAADTLDDIIRQMEEAQDMKRRAGACPNNACGGG